MFIILTDVVSLPLGKFFRLEFLAYLHAVLLLEYFGSHNLVSEFQVNRHVQVRHRMEWQTIYDDRERKEKEEREREELLKESEKEEQKNINEGNLDGNDPVEVKPESEIELDTSEEPIITDELAVSESVDFVKISIG